MPVVTMRELLEAGVHFGHQTRRWNPKMRPYLFTERNDIYIIDLQKTLVMIGNAYNAIRQAVADGGTVLFVGSKKQAQAAVEENAKRCQMPFVNLRWLGGTLTNFTTIHGRILYLDELERRDREGELELLPKKEALQVRRQIEKLNRNLLGIRNMHSLPSMVFVIDTLKEHIAVAEARKLGIPLVALVDTNCDPDVVDYVIPGNDDAIRAANLICRIVADAAIEGQQIRESRLAEEMKAEAPAPEAAPAGEQAGTPAVPAYSATPEDTRVPASPAEPEAPGETSAPPGGSEEGATKEEAGERE